jgi:nicotinate-nucleotide adenylyltransferase
MRIGVFGGTFDPVHLGHLVMAEMCREEAALDQVHFIPAARPPHKLDASITSFTARAEMLRLALAGYPVFQVNELEKDRPGPSFTADTLEELTSRHPGDSFDLIIGGDCLPDLPSWHAPARILQLAGLLVVPRPNFPNWPVDRLLTALGLPGTFPVRCQAIASPQLEISSRDLRQRVAAGRSIRYQVPRAVECYIETHRLYRDK